MDGRSLYHSIPPAWQSRALSAVWVFSKSISYSSWVHYYIPQDPLQLRYHVTKFGSLDCVGRSDVNDFQHYSHETTPHGPSFSFPLCQLDAEDSAETCRAP